MKKIEPIHPGEILQQEFLTPMGLSAYALAKATGMTQTRLSEILKGRRAVTADTALRLARAFNMSADFWMNLQMHYDLEVARDEVGKKIEEEVKVVAA
ncbi:HigA family addiction module antitoxin [Emcibacter sp.]|uniref:HigA family addiction module antitoxin n=1 Tax=Emcibacter sp. TaxID=1979954 RepID=UPI002AA7861A|nr:HigA family addiction module antitoxin [Emcibacter sp.]